MTDTYISASSDAEYASWQDEVADSVKAADESASQLDVTVRTLRKFREAVGANTTAPIWKDDDQARSVYVLGSSIELVQKYGSQAAAGQRAIVKAKALDDLTLVGDPGEALTGVVLDGHIFVAEPALGGEYVLDEADDLPQSTVIPKSGQTGLPPVVIVAGIVVIGVGIVGWTLVAMKACEVARTYIEEKTKVELVDAQIKYQATLVAQGVPAGEADDRSKSAMKSVLEQQRLLAEAEAEKEKQREKPTDELSKTVSNIMWGAFGIAVVGGVIYLGWKVLPMFFAPKQAAYGMPLLAQANPTGRTTHLKGKPGHTLCGETAHDETIVQSVKDATCYYCVQDWEKKHGGGRLKNPAAGFNKSKFKKTIYDRWLADEVRVEVWYERDRLHIGIQDEATGDYLVSWWDDDAQQMFEDGFFVGGKGQRELEESVVKYADEIGVRPYAGTKRRASKNPTQSMTWGKMPSRDEFYEHVMHSEDSEGNRYWPEDGTYHMTFGHTDSLAAELADVWDAFDYPEEAYDAVVRLRDVSEQGDDWFAEQGIDEDDIERVREAAGSLASGIMQTLGYEWV